MENERSVSRWITRLKAGDAEAAQNLWNRFFQRLVVQARRRLGRSPATRTGSEDVAASVFESLWRAAVNGRLADVRNRDELWWLLLALTRRKVASAIRRETAVKRGGRFPHRQLSTMESGATCFEEICGPTPEPGFCVALEEEYSRLLELLRDEQLRRIAVQKLEGASNDDIAEREGIALATVTRKLRLIRETWARELGP